MLRVKGTRLTTHFPKEEISHSAVHYIKVAGDFTVHAMYLSSNCPSSNEHSCSTFLCLVKDRGAFFLTFSIHSMSVCCHGIGVRRAQIDEHVMDQVLGGRGH